MMLCCLILLPFWGGNQTDEERPLVAADFSVALLQEHVAYLGADAREGRGTGTKGERQAALYLADRLRQLGIRPMGGRGSYLQQIPMTGSTPLSDCKLSIRHKQQSKDFLLGADYLLFSAGLDTFMPEPVPLIFAGYGITAPEYGYDDYRDLAVTGAVVVLLDGEPLSPDPAFFRGASPSLHALPKMKQRNAAAHGALGSIIIPVPRDEMAMDWSYWRRTFAFEHVSLPYDLSSGFCALFNPSAAEALFGRARMSLAEVMRVEKKGQLPRFPLKQKIYFKGSFEERQFRAPNVVGLLPGRDPNLAARCVLLSAHYDHLGKGIPFGNDSIYNGVVDNALGCAGLLEIARLLSQEETRLKRSVLFLFVTGEEKGLLGSRFYCENPLVPLHRTVANINVDGLAMLDTFEDVIGVGGEYSTLGRMLQNVALDLELQVSPLPPLFQSEQLFSRSDQLSFAQAGIPAILISEGFRYRNLAADEGFRLFLEWGQHRYHTPMDDLNQPIDYAAVSQHLGVIYALVTALTSQPEEPTWTVDGRYRQARRRSIAQKR